LHPRPTEDSSLAEGSAARARRRGHALPVAWLRVGFGGRYDARTEDYLAEAGLRPIRRRSYLSDSVVSLVLRPI
jgi:hypothetical protein